MKKITVLFISLLLFFVSSNVLAQNQQQERLREILVEMEAVKPQITELENFLTEFYAELDNNESASKGDYFRLLKLVESIIDLSFKTAITEGVIRTALGEDISDPLLELQILTLQINNISFLEFGEKMFKTIKQQLVILNQQKEQLIQQNVKSELSSALPEN